MSPFCDLPVSRRTSLLGRATQSAVVAALLAVVALGASPLRARLSAQVTAQVTAQATAQAGATTPVRVIVRDTTRRGIEGADVSIVRGLTDVRARATTGAGGRASLAVVPDSGNYDLVVRRIGFERVDRFIHVGSDSETFDVSLMPVAQTLGAVKVTAEQDLKYHSYHIGADEIANSTQMLLDATDILGKLRPDMICGRECMKGAGAIKAIEPTMVKCPGLVMDGPPASCPVDSSPPSLSTNVWVNGTHIRMIMPSVMAVARQNGPLTNLSPGAMTVLSEIKPEHIESITYLDSTDTTVVRPGASGAVFVTLKPGVAYEPGKGSYVLAVAHAATANDSVGPKTPARLPLYRYRLLGVYDDSTGDPIVDAEVLDVETGDRTQTTPSGIVSLIFLPEGGSPLRITKPGYEDLTLAVQISPEKATPLTLTMVRKRER
jgi:hypothetical protein